MKRVLFLVKWRSIDAIDREYKTLCYAASPERASGAVATTEWYMKRVRTMIISVEPVQDD